jgi:hypothetical protein
VNDREAGIVLSEEESVMERRLEYIIEGINSKDYSASLLDWLAKRR